MVPDVPQIPALPPPTGPNAQKARFFDEIASAFEFLALYNVLSAEDQKYVHDIVQGMAATAYAAIITNRRT